MELKTSEPFIYLISGKARHGKDTSKDFIQKYYESKGKKVINLQFSSYIKEYAKKISNWNGSEEDKPRELLQTLGTDVIRKRIDELFFIKRIIDDIKVYSYFFDVITISDVRFKKEIDYIKKFFNKTYSIRIVRPNFDNGLTDEGKIHLSEIDLDDYAKHDYIIENNGSLIDLENNIINMIGDIDEEVK